MTNRPMRMGRQGRSRCSGRPIRQRSYRQVRQEDKGFFLRGLVALAAAVLLVFGPSETAARVKALLERPVSLTALWEKAQGVVSLLQEETTMEGITIDEEGN